MRFVLILLVAAALAGCLESDPNAADDADATDLPTQTVEETITFSNSGLIMAGNEDAGTTGAGCGNTAPDPVVDRLSWEWVIEAPDGATNAKVSDLVFTATYPATMPEGDIFVYNPDGQQMTDATTFNPNDAPGPEYYDTVTVEGKHAIGTWRIDVAGCLGSGEVSLDATAVLSYDE